MMELSVSYPNQQQSRDTGIRLPPPYLEAVAIWRVSLFTAHDGATRLPAGSRAKTGMATE